uniref:Uncharacterized protein n=1 Tax=Amphimedon queenslandica TaxID=400682 RepID=A0A1X7TIU1_AMPQE
PHLQAASRMCIFRTVLSRSVVRPFSSLG